MEKEPVYRARRDLIKATATLACRSSSDRSDVRACATIPTGNSSRLPRQRSSPRRLSGCRLAPDTKLTIERRGQVALFGLNRPQVQNRVDPETFQALAKGDLRL